MYVLSAKELNNSSKSKGMVTRGRGGGLLHTYIFSAICQRNCFNLDIDIDIDIDILKNKKMSIGEKRQRLATTKSNRYYRYIL